MIVVALYQSRATRAYTHAEAFAELRDSARRNAEYYDKYESSPESDGFLRALRAAVEGSPLPIGIREVLEGARYDESMWPPFPLAEFRLVAEVAGDESETFKSLEQAVGSASQSFADKSHLVAVVETAASD